MKISINIQGLSQATVQAVIAVLERIGVTYSIQITGVRNHILVECEQADQMTRLTSFLLANPVQYSFVEDHHSYSEQLEESSPDDVLAQVARPWREQRDPVSYLRKLMVEHYGLNTDDPAVVDELWQEGYNPPMPPARSGAVELTPETSHFLYSAWYAEDSRKRHEAEYWFSQAQRDIANRELWRSKAVAQGVPEDQADRFIFSSRKVKE